MIEEKKLKYVCSIAMEYLDNDEDGVVDDEIMPNYMDNGALLLFPTKLDAQNVFDGAPADYSAL